MTPRTEALAFRIWQYANPRGWDCTAGEVGDAIGSSPMQVGIACSAKGWGTRLRAHRTYHSPVSPYADYSILVGEATHRAVDEARAKADAS